MKKKVLITTYNIPYPLNNGGAIAQYFFLNEMSNYFDVTLCSLSRTPLQSENLEKIKKNIPTLRVEYLEVFEEKNKGSMLRKSFLKGLNKIKNYVSQSKEENQHILGSKLCAMEIDFFTYYQELIKNNDFDLVQFEFFETITFLDALPKKIKSLIIHHEIRSKRNGFLTEDNPYKIYLNEITKTCEFAYLNKANMVVVFNEEDKEYLREIKSEVRVSPFGLPENLIIKDKASKQFDKLLFMGNENHYPNKEGLVWFIDNIYLKKISEIQMPLHITGEWSEDFRKKYDKYSFIKFRGFLKNLQDVYDKSIMLAPIISGSGMRTKIIQAMANKIPILSTYFASEGLCKGNEDHILHFESLDSFIDIIEKIKRQDTFLHDTSLKSFAYFEDNFSKNRLFSIRMQIYKELLC